MFSAQTVKAPEFVCANWTDFKPYPTVPDTVGICQIGKKSNTSF